MCLTSNTLMPSADCLFVTEILAMVTAIMTGLFAISEYLGWRKGDAAVTAVAIKTARKSVDVVVRHVSPRNSVDGERPWRKSSELPRIVENT